MSHYHDTVVLLTFGRRERLSFFFFWAPSQRRRLFADLGLLKKDQEKNTTNPNLHRVVDANVL